MELNADLLYVIKLRCRLCAPSARQRMSSIDSGLTVITVKCRLRGSPTHNRASKMIDSAHGKWFESSEIAEGGVKRGKHATCHNSSTV